MHGKEQSTFSLVQEADAKLTVGTNTAIKISKAEMSRAQTNIHAESTKSLNQNVKTFVQIGVTASFNEARQFKYFNEMSLWVKLLL